MPKIEVLDSLSESEVVRGRVKDTSKPQTFNQLWTSEEQRELEELLITFPPEEVEARRWDKIAKTLGNRTTQQVIAFNTYIKTGMWGLHIRTQQVHVGYVSEHTTGMWGLHIRTQQIRGGYISEHNRYVGATYHNTTGMWGLHITTHNRFMYFMGLPDSARLNSPTFNLLKATLRYMRYKVMRCYSPTVKNNVLKTYRHCLWVS